MPPVATFVALLGNGVAFGAAASAAFGALGAALLQIGGSLLLSAASKALMGKPDSGLNGRSVTVRQPVMPRDICYGQVRKGGVIVYMDSRNNDSDLDLVIVFSGNRVKEIGNIYFNGDLAFRAGSTTPEPWLQGAAGIQRTNGDANQAALPYLVQVSGGKWTANHRLRGCSAIYLHLIFLANVFPNGIPNVTADIMGSDEIYDPRTGQTGYSENAALCLANYMANPAYGIGATIGAADGIETADLIAAANVCDESVPIVGGGVEARYVTYGVVGLSQTPKAVIESMLTAMAGTCAWQAGSWRIYAGAYRIPTVSFGEDDVVDGGLQMATRISMADNFNAVRGQFISPLNDWQPDDFPAYESAVYLAEDGGVRKYRDITLPFTPSASMAQRLAKIELERIRRQFTLSMAGKLTMWRATVGDTVNMSYARWGMAAKPFEVSSLSLGLASDEGGPRLVPQLTLRETSPLVYTWSTSEASIYAAAPRTTLPSAFTILPPGGLSVSEQLYQTLAGSGVKALARITWTASPSATVAQYQVEARIGLGAWQVLGRTDQLSFDFLDIAPAVWEFRVNALSQLNVASRYVSVTQDIYGLNAPPAALQNVTLQTAGGLAILKWDQPADLDVRIGGSVAIRHSVNAVPGWTNSVSMDRVAGAQAIAVVPQKPGTYLLRAEDSSDVGGPVTAIPSSGAQALAFAPITSLQEDAAFAGTKTNVIVNAGALELDATGDIDSEASFDAIVNVDNLGGIYPSGTYVFAAGIDFGSVKLSRLRSLIDMIAIDIFDNIDTRPGSVDDWASWDGLDGSEVDVVVEIRTTQTDPAASPIWTAWSRVDSNEVQARGIEARAILSTVSASFKPSVSQLRLFADEVI